MLKIKRFFFIFIATFIAVFGAVGFVFAGSLTGVEYGEATGLGDENPIIIIAKVIRIALGFLGIVALVLFIYAGFLWMTSEGNQEKVEQAKRILKNAAIGILIIFASFAIVSFILNSLLGSGGPTSSSSSGDNAYNAGIGALGSGILQSVYPEPNQKEVPRNTSIIVTFREVMDPATICETAGPTCNGENIVPENVRIFKTNQGDACATDCSGNVTDVRVYTNDNKTFVFMPSTYLGSPSEYIWYSVNLSSDINKGNGDPAFPSLATGFLWSFEVSNKIDLVPPKILSGGVFPVPDNEQDEIGTTVAAIAAAGQITVSSQPQVYVAASAGAPVAQGVSEPATVSGTYNCVSDGTITASISVSMTVDVSGVAGVVGGDSVNDGAASLGCGLVLLPGDGTFTAGNSWTIAVVSEKQADKLIVGGNLYTFVSGLSSGNEITLGANTGATAANIGSALAAHPDVSALVSGNSVNLTAKVAGNTGNNIALSGISSALSIVPMNGGVNSEEITTVHHKKDKPRNSVIQINFDEAMNPMTLSGTSDELAPYIRIVNAISSPVPTGGACTADADCASFNCSAGICSGINTYLEGKFVISNQYKTVEFVSNKECGRNACGEKIYCLPENSQLRVELNAASLDTCLSNDDCATRSPFNTCGANGVCQDSSSVNFPLSSPAFNGAMDTALNSLDGNRNGNAQGPISFFNENNSDPSEGDNFRWSFFISDKIDLGAPLVELTDADNYDTNVNLSAPLSVEFNKLMMSSSLTTGSIVINNGKDDVAHKLMNLWSFASQPIGYWTASEGIDDSPADGEADWTRAFIRHTDFSDSTQYRAEIGSGVKDIYQNCFKPCDGPACTGENAANPSCCSGTVSDVDGVEDQCPL